MSDEHGLNPTHPRHVPLIEELYHAEKEHDSSTKLRDFEEDPALYLHRYVTGKIEPKTSKPLRLGQLDHAVCLQHDRISEVVAVAPDDILGKGGVKSTRAWFDFVEANAGRVACTQKEYEQSLWKRDVVFAHEHAARLLTQATYREHSIFRNTDEGYRLRSRLDVVDTHNCIVADVKNTRQPFDEFWRSVRDFSLHAQAAFYCDMFDALYGAQPEFFWIAVHNDPPFSTCVIPVPSHVIEDGRRLNEESLAKLYACKRGDRPWLKDGYGELRPFTHPPWMFPNESPEGSEPLESEVFSDEY